MKQLVNSATAIGRTGARVGWSLESRTMSPRILCARTLSPYPSPSPSPVPVSLRVAGCELRRHMVEVWTCPRDSKPATRNRGLGLGILDAKTKRPAVRGVGKAGNQEVLGFPF